MSYVLSVKKLLSEDLKGLITHYTGFEEGTLEFKKCEESAWSIIFDRYYPSVNEHRVKSTLWEFVEKFKIHGFPQKAKNLTKLIEAYCQLSYFKKYSNTDVQWGLIDFLIKLSFKPTNALEDDPPLDLNKNIVSEVETFDWATYLKEGLEKFCLPSEDGDSLSDWSDDNSELEVVPDKSLPLSINKASHSSNASNISYPSHIDLGLELLRIQEAAEAHLQELTDNFWWKNPNLREIPSSKHPEANYCITWEKLNNVGPKTRILSEYRVLCELINMLGKPSKCYFIYEASKNVFKVLPYMSISSLSPNMFSIVIEKNFCEYFPHIRKLQEFISEIDKSEVPSHVPAAYRAYALRLQKHLHTYYKKLIEVERKVNAQESIITIRYLLNEIQPFLNQIQFLSILHDEIIPEGWRDKDWRSNSFTLLCSLYEELKQVKNWIFGDTDWPVRNILILFVDSLYPFLTGLAQHLSGYPHRFVSDEFFLTSTGEILVPYENSTSREFWEPILRTSSSAIASCFFLLQLESYSTFFKNEYKTDIFFVRLVEKLLEKLLYKKMDFESEEQNEIDKFKEQSEAADNFSKRLLDGSHWDCLMREVTAPSPKLVNKSPSDRLSEILCDVDLSTYALHIDIQCCLQIIIEEYMEPKGFAAEILLDQLKLLEHLRALFVSIQATNVFSTVIFIKWDGKKNSRKLLFYFKYCLEDVLPLEYAQNFQLHINQNGLQDVENLLNVPDHMKLHYTSNSNIMSLIPQEAINGYGRIFSFLMKLRLALTALNRLIFDRIEETCENYLRLRRLCSLRTWFLHLMNSLNLYFSTYSDSVFQIKIKDLCLTERKLNTLLEAHLDFIEKWKYHCFLTDGHPCYDNLIEVLNLSVRLNYYWKREKTKHLADYHLDSIEKDYVDTIKNFALNLQLYDDRLVDRSDTFSFLYEEVVNNVPVPSEEEVISCA